MFNNNQGYIPPPGYNMQPQGYPPVIVQGGYPAPYVPGIPGPYGPGVIGPYGQAGYPGVAPYGAPGVILTPPCPPQNYQVGPYPGCCPPGVRCYHFGRDRGLHLPHWLDKVVHGRRYSSSSSSSDSD